MRTFINPPAFLFICFIFSQAGPVYAKNDPHGQAVQNADALIENYKQSVTSGDPAAIRDAALAVQKNPLAVQRVNQTQSGEFKQQISGDVMAVRETAKTDIKKQAAEHYGVHENRIDFLEAANPSTEPKLGQDWDVTVRVDGMAVPLDVAAPMVQQSFYEAAKGEKPASAEEAAHFAHEQSVEPINQSSAEAYGSGGRKEVVDPETGETKTISEGQEIIEGPKDAPLRDTEHLGHVMEHKSDLAKNRADEKRAAGQEAEAVGWDMEQGRQYSKQEARQIETRVEAKGGQIPEHIEKGNAILDQVASGDISPEEGRKQLADMGETPETLIKKGTGLVEAAEKLGTTPAEKIERAQSGEAPRDVFVENVKEKMALKKLERDAAAMKEGPRANLLDGEGKSSSAHLEETLPDTRAEQVRDRAARAASEQGIEAPKSLLGGGKSSTAHTDVQGTADSVMDTVDWTGWAVEAYQKEKQEAADEGRWMNPLNVGVNAFKGLAAGKTYEISKKHSEAAVAEAREKGESPLWTIPGTLLSAAGEFATETLTGVKKQHEQYQKEEMEKEIERAQKAGDAADPWRAKIPALMRIMGDVTQVNRFADWWAYDEEAEKAARDAAEMQKKMKIRAKAAVEVGLTGFGDIERGLQAALEKSGGEVTDEVLELQKQYHERMSGLQDLRDDLFAKGYVDLKDPEWSALNQSANLLDPRVVETMQKDIVNEKIETMKKALAEKDCSGIKDSVPAWDPKTETAVCGCPGGMELNRKGTYCRAPVAEQLRTKKCGPGMIVEYNQAYDVVTCDCPRGYIRDYNSGISDMDFMPCVKLGASAPSGGYEPYSGPAAVDPDSYLQPVPSYAEEQNQIAMQNQMFAALRNANQRAYGSNAQQGINLNQMYGNMASGGSQWSDPTNTASGSAYRPAGYTTYRATPAAPQTYTPPRNTYTSGPGQGEFSVSPGTKKDWCTTGRDAAGNCAAVDFGKTY